MSASPPSSDAQPIAPSNRLGLYGATMVGVSAMLGAGIFVLSGVALKMAGPAATIAFALNGVIVILTAFSFAELASAFPESGGSYVFARKVFPIGGAFAAGWVLWLAYVLAAALYGLGFASFVGFAVEMVGAWAGRAVTLPGWLVVVTAEAVLVLGAVLLLKRGAAAGNAISLAKVIAFVILVVPGIVIFFGSEPGTLKQGFVPLFPTELGVVGTFVAMGYTFIALEGFEVIAAIAEEVDRPSYTIPKAMFLSIGITLVIYLLLLFVMVTIGGDGTGPAWEDLGNRGDQAVAVAAERYLGSFGAVLVVVAGLLATFSALTSALLASSRVSFSMARDRALHHRLAEVDPTTGTPGPALILSVGLTLLLVAIMGEVEVAGAAASLIFLVSFAMANGAGLLVRVRGGKLGGYQAPLYPFLPLLGASACVGLAAFQLVQVPLASLVALGWLVVGGILYQLNFRMRAQTVSARAEALDSMLVRLRGREPLVLVPLANPDRAETLVRFASALVPRRFGRLLALTVAVHDPDGRPGEGVVAYERTQSAMRRAVDTTCRLKRPFEGAMVLDADVPEAVARVIAERDPEVVLLGMSKLDAEAGTRMLERVIAAAEADVVVLNAPPTWNPDEVRSILVPVAGQGGHNPLRARVIGMFQRERACEVRLIRVVRSEAEQAKARALLEHVKDDLGSEHGEVVVSGNAAREVIQRSKDVDLIVLGLSRDAGRQRLVGDFVRLIAAEAECPLVAIARAT